MTERQTADNLELGLDLATYGLFIAGERAIAEGRVRREILAHNAGVAKIRAARAARRDAQLAVGRDLQARFLATRSARDN